MGLGRCLWLCCGEATIMWGTGRTEDYEVGEFCEKTDAEGSRAGETWYDVSGYRGTGNSSQRVPRARAMAGITTATSLLKWGPRVVCTAFLEPAPWRGPRPSKWKGVKQGSDVETVPRGGGGRTLAECRGVGLASNCVESAPEALPKALLASSILILRRSAVEILSTT